MECISINSSLLTKPKKRSLAKTLASMSALWLAVLTYGVQIRFTSSFSLSNMLISPGKPVRQKTSSNHSRLIMIQRIKRWESESGVVLAGSLTNFQEGQSIFKQESGNMGQTSSQEVKEHHGVQSLGLLSVIL